MPDETALTGLAAFNAIERLLVGGQRVDCLFGELPFRRIQQALSDGPAPSPRDLAVLVRQALRFRAIRDTGNGPAELLIKHGKGWPTEVDWCAVGVTFRESGDKYLVQALPWEPTWLPDCALRGVDAAAAGAENRRSLQFVPGDPFLAKVKRKDYLSLGQQAAVRAALTTAPGDTLVICLPTGEGKSLVFQIVAELGFGDGGPDPGVTLVVTPTVTLAMDHERAALDLGMPDIPRAYIGGNSDRNREIAERIASGTQGLCFASPEAVCGFLRSSLMESARGSHLRAFVIDEAHLVDAWGAQFRPEFQLLSGVLRDLSRAAGSIRRFRTFLLTATLTDETFTTLRKLFSSDSSQDHDHFSVCGTVRLRPEIDYWVARPCEPEEQQSRVLEAIHHLPRPAILYLTEVNEAKWWYQKLQKTGFQRLACVTGKTSDEERHWVVDNWRSGAIDLVVATSAFGLGIDNPDVRTIIHACVPETLDRFYQEVGRGGRDGQASISLVVYTHHDLRTAASLNQRRLISVKRGLERWPAMFRHQSCYRHGDQLFTVRLDVPPATGERDIDMVSEGNTQWNARTLLLMAKAGLISLEGSMGTVGGNSMEVDSAAAEPEDWHPVQTVKILDFQHLDLTTWEEKVEPERRRLKSALRQNLEAMKYYLRQKECIAETLAPLYELHDPSGNVNTVPVAKACGGCPACRRNGIMPWNRHPIISPLPWRLSPPGEPILSMLGSDNRLVVFCSSSLFVGSGEDSSSTREKRRFREILVRLIKSGFRDLFVLPGVEPDLASRLFLDAGSIFFVSDHIAANHLPVGPAIVLVPPDARIGSVELQRSRQSYEARVFFVAEDFRDPDRPDVRFYETNRGRQFRLDEFRGRIGL